jgi:hypothetical protein
MQKQRTYFFSFSFLFFWVGDGGGGIFKSPTVLWLIEHFSFQANARFIYSAKFVFQGWVGGGEGEAELLINLSNAAIKTEIFTYTDFDANGCKEALLFCLLNHCLDEII